MNHWTLNLGLGAAIALVIAVSTPVSADDDASTDGVTFTKDVLPVLQENCQVCHRPSGTNMGGMIAPMSLMSYEEVRPWAKSIAREVEARNMPPWHASANQDGLFANERKLSEKEIATIIRWAQTGAPMGDPKDAPAPVVFPSGGWTFGEPDFVLEMPEEYVVADDTEDQYINFTVDIPEEFLSEDRWVKAFEFRPGSPVVHHIIGYVLPPDQADREAGDRGMLGGIAPGNEPDIFPDGYGFKLPKGSKFVFAMHYHKEAGPGTAAPDRSVIGIKLYPKGVTPKQIRVEAIGNRGFEIPPNQGEWQVGMARTFDKPTIITYLMPHMHLRGKAAKYTAFYPDGKEEILLEVPRYDFNWQTSYEFKEPKRIPAGTRIEVRMWFDNSTANIHNPDANKSIRFGGPTTDEMALGWLSYTVEGDQSTAVASTQDAF